MEAGDYMSVMASLHTREITTTQLGWHQASRVCVCVCECVCVRVCARVCARVCVCVCAGLHLSVLNAETRPMMDSTSAVASAGCRGVCVCVCRAAEAQTGALLRKDRAGRAGRKEGANFKDECARSSARRVTGPPCAD